MLPNPEVSYWCDRIQKHHTDPTESGSISIIRVGILHTDPTESESCMNHMDPTVSRSTIRIRLYPGASHGSDRNRIRKQYTDPTVSGIPKHHTDPKASYGFATIIRIRPFPNSQPSSESEFANIIRIRQFPNSQPSSGSDSIRIKIHHPDSNVY